MLGRAAEGRIVLEDIASVFDVSKKKVAEALGKLAVFQGVCEFPMRVKCATLAWHTLRSALGGGDAVTTE